MPVHRIAKDVGTPVYIYSQTELIRNYNAYRRSFQTIPHLICYALKANSNLTLLKLLAREGSGADIVSGGELYRAMKAGFPPNRIVFAGVGKTGEEIETAIRKNILALHIESEQELLLTDSIAARLHRKAPVSFRVNPNIDARTHPYISTGLRKHKFGIPIHKALRLYEIASRLRHIKVEGLHMHLGSQIAEVRPFVDAIQRVLQLVDRLQARGIVLKHLDIGGGLAVSYESSQSKHPGALARKILPLFKNRHLQLILEPGRSIVASAGVLLTRVLYTKQNGRKHFVIVDAGMNDFIRPALYNAEHRITPCEQNGEEQLVQDIVGPVCESGDFFAKDRAMQRCLPGDLVAIQSVGAYGFSMSSNYNSRPRAAEVLVHGREYSVIRKRETLQDLIRNEMS